MADKELTPRELEERIEELHSWIAQLSKKISTIIGNQQHYLRHRAPEVFKNQKKRLAKADALMRRMEAIPKINICTSYKGKVRAQRVLFMCTANEARKLRAMLNVDFRQFNSSRPKKLHQSMGYSGHTK